MDLSQLPDTYYRVSAKALIFDDERRILVFQDDKGYWELPGGGWNHDESYVECLQREIREEMQIEAKKISESHIVYKCVNEHGVHKVCIAARVEIQSGDFVPSSDDLVAAKFVGKDEFLGLSFQASESGVISVVDKIWSEN